jgi:hypothetical protein
MRTAVDDETAQMVVAYNGNSMTDNGKKKRRRTAAKAATPGPRIVRAWFDTVINPILRALERENSRLIRSNWSWQYRLRVLEEIRPVRVYISHGMQDNLEQFLNFTPEVKPHVDRHATKWRSSKKTVPRCTRRSSPSRHCSRSIEN